MSENKCVVCNAIIPEGRQVCWNCEHQEDTYHCVICGKAIPKPKFSFGGRADGKSMMRLNYNLSQMCCSEECFDTFIEEIRSELNEEN